MEDYIIIGIDPGTTKGYAVLDFNGDILAANSSKKLNIETIIKEVFKFGKPVLIGTDVNKVPSFVEKVAARLGARVSKPEFNIPKQHKRIIIKRFLKDKKFQTSNKHESDALIAAILAYKSIKPLLKKIEDKLTNTSKSYLIEDIKKIVVKENINIKDAVKLLE
ncbi:MAG: DUF460 domain-containing protein [Nanoarchaeota archaeon]